MQTGQCSLTEGRTDATDRHLSPIRVAGYGVLSYLVVLLVAPVKVSQDVLFLPIAFVVASYVAFALGVTVFRPSRSSPRAVVDPGRLLC